MSFPGRHMHSTVVIPRSTHRYPSSFGADHIITLSSFRGRRGFIAPEPGIGLVTPTTIDARHFLALALRAPAVFALAILQTQLVLPAKNNTSRNGEGKVALLKNKRPHPKVQPFGSPRS